METLLFYLIIQCLGIVLIFIAGICNAIMDVVQFHYERSIFIEKQNQLFWNPKESWKNKYKEDLVTPKFPGSITFFVFWTDSWHRHKFFMLSLLFIGLPLIAFFSYSIVYLLLFVILARMAFGIGFTHYYYKFIKRDNPIYVKLHSIFIKLKYKTLNIFTKRQ